MEHDIQAAHGVCLLAPMELHAPVFATSASRTVLQSDTLPSSSTLLPKTTTKVSQLDLGCLALPQNFECVFESENINEYG